MNSFRWMLKSIDSEPGCSPKISFQTFVNIRIFAFQSPEEISILIC
jgi:hypothetical protein